MRLRVWADAVLCWVIRRLARWTVVVVDRWDGEEHPTPVRLRWRSNTDAWIREMTRRHDVHGRAVQFEARRLP